MPAKAGMLATVSDSYWVTTCTFVRGAPCAGEREKAKYTLSPAIPGKHAEAFRSVGTAV